MTSKWLSHSSFIGHLGSYGDRWLNPIALMTNGKSTKLTSEVLPEKVNAGLSKVMEPFDKIDQTINPVRKIHLVDRAANITKAKPGDALAIAAAAVFGGGAAFGGGAGGAAGGGLGAGVGEGAGAGAGLGEGGALGTVGGFGGVGTDGAVAGLGEGGLGAGAGAGGADVAGLEALDSSAVTSEGAEPALMGNGGPASTSSLSSNWQMPQQQQQEQRRPLDQLAIINNPTLEERQAALMQPSSRKLKTPGAGPVPLAAVAHAGATGRDQVSQNGVHIGSIRALHKQISDLESAARAKGYKV